MNFIARIGVGFIVCCQISAQNLVPNPSFEDTTACPTSPNQLNRAKFWVNPTLTSPDYYNSCASYTTGASMPYTSFGFQPARTGVAFLGIYAFQKGYTNAREYAQVQLSDTLILSHVYHVSFYANLSNASQYSVSSMGSYLSSIPVANSNTLMLNYSPQIQSPSSVQLTDSVNWMLIEDTMLSNGTEQYLTIGNFKTDAQSDTSYIGWFSTANIAYYYIDDVSVIDLGPLGIERNTLDKYFKIFPNPANDFLKIETLLRDYEFVLFDLLGNQLIRQKGSQNSIVEINQLPNGIYLGEITSPTGRRTEKIIIQH